MFGLAAVAARRRRHRRDVEAMRLRAELRELVERGTREADFRGNARRLLRELAATDAGRAFVAIVEYGQRAARGAS